MSKQKKTKAVSNPRRQETPEGLKKALPIIESYRRHMDEADKHRKAMDADAQKIAAMLDAGDLGVSTLAENLGTTPDKAAKRFKRFRKG